MITRFGSFKLKEKLSNRLCERVCGHRGGGSGPGRVRAPVRFKPSGAKAGHL